MDTFFATKKSGKSSCGHTCCQRFVTEKGFIYVVPMKKKSEVLLAIIEFAKGIGAPDWGTSQQPFVPNCGQPTLDSDLKWGKEFFYYS